MGLLTLSAGTGQLVTQFMLQSVVTQACGTALLLFLWYCWVSLILHVLSIEHHPQ
jgi:hypothetical protein